MPIEPWRVVYAALGVPLDDYEKRREATARINDILAEHPPEPRGYREYVKAQKAKRRALKRHLTGLSAALRDPPYRKERRFETVTGGMDAVQLAAALDRIYAAFDPPPPGPRPRPKPKPRSETLREFGLAYARLYEEMTGRGAALSINENGKAGPFLRSASAILQMAGMDYSPNAIRDAMGRKPASPRRGGKTRAAV